MLDKIEEIRQLLTKFNIDSYIIPTSDEYLSEYVPEDSQRLKFISNFSGSSGTLIITNTRIAFFTDGRYIEQAAKEIDENIVEIYLYNYKKPHEWIAQNNVLSMGYYPFTHTINELKLYSCNLVAVPNLVDHIWQDKPCVKKSTIYDHPVCYAGEDRKTKMDKIIETMEADYLLLTKPESICWLLNIRGDDVEFNPFILGYALINRKGEVFLFTKNQLNLPLPIPKLNYNLVQNIEEFIDKIMPCTIQADPTSAPIWFFNKVKNIISKQDPCVLPRACKNIKEQKGAVIAHKKDALAMIKFMFWLENHKQNDVTEYDLAKQLANIRLSEKSCISPSFASIVGYAENSSIIHYCPQESSAKLIRDKDIILIDSGGQYLEGTTDITRTIHLGKPKKQHIIDYTLVLKGHIALASAIFPIGTVGWQLDVLARQYLWSAKKDYNHGTSHGVGSFLSVHEGPQSISRYGNTAILQEGMLLSNEPGYYIAGKYGIRLENIILVQKYSEDFLCFKTLTLVPFQKKLIDLTMLTTKEIDWINNYHKNIVKIISPLIADRNLKKYLESECKTI